MNRQALGVLLAREGLIESPVLPETHQQALPGLVTLLSGFGAWLGAIFILGALTALSLDLLDSAVARGGIGVVVCAGCAWRSRSRPSSAFAAQFLTVLGVAGAALVVSACMDMDAHVWPLALAAVAAIVLVANPEPVSRLLMAVFLVCGLAWASLQWGLAPAACVGFAVACVRLWLKQGAWAARGAAPVIAPLAVACTGALVLLPVGVLAGSRWSLLLHAMGAGDDLAMSLAMLQGAWFAPTGLALVLATAIVLVRRERRSAAGKAGFDRWDVAAVLGVALLAAACWSSPGILACLLAWVLGKAAGRPFVAGLGLAGIVLYLFEFYYSLETTLLAKGLALGAAGLLLLSLHFLLRRMAPPVADSSDEPPAGLAAHG